MNVRTTGAALALLAIPLAAQAQAVPTDVIVRAVAQDAKIIGSGVGGARITIKDARSGAVLAEGIQEGSTGNTGLIVSTPIERGAKVFDTPGAGAFSATLALERPTLIEIIAEGPLGTPHAMQRSSKTLWMIPGRDLVGEGVILVLNGFTIVIDDAVRSAVHVGETLDVKAKVTMLCGCPTEPGGLWDADDIELVVRLARNGEVLAEAPMRFAGERSTYTGAISAPESGDMELQVIAVDRGKANTGIATLAVTAR